MFISGNKIALRALEPADADLLYSWENDQRLWAVSFTQIPFSKFILDEFVNAMHQDIYTNKQLRLIIIQKDNRQAVGTLDLFDFDPQHNRCGLGIFVSDAFRKRGYAAEAVSLAAEYAFGTLLLNQIFADVGAENNDSLALFEKSGFVKVGLKKGWHRTAKNKYEDVWLLQLMNPQ